MEIRIISVPFQFSLIEYSCVELHYHSFKVTKEKKMSVYESKNRAVLKDLLSFLTFWTGHISQCLSPDSIEFVSCQRQRRDSSQQSHIMRV